LDWNGILFRLNIRLWNFKWEKRKAKSERKEEKEWNPISHRHCNTHIHNMYNIKSPNLRDVDEEEREMGQWGRGRREKRKVWISNNKWGRKRWGCFFFVCCFLFLLIIWIWKVYSSSWVASLDSEVHNVKLSRNNCMIKVLSLYEASSNWSNLEMASSKAFLASSQAFFWSLRIS